MKGSFASGRDAQSSCSRKNCYPVGVALNKQVILIIRWCLAVDCQFIDRHPGQPRTKFWAYRCAKENEKSIVESREHAIEQLGGNDDENSHLVETCQWLFEP